MRRTTRLTAVLLATLVTFVAWAPAASAVGNVDAARRAAAYVAGQASTVTDAGVAADSLLALAASSDPSIATQAAPLVSVLASGAPAAAASSPESAAKLAIAASAVGLDPHSVNGANLVAAVQAGIHTDGSFGASPGPVASGLALVALTRAGETVPPRALAYLVRLANSDGGFGPAPGQPSDADSTAVALLGLATQTDSISARDAGIRAIAWATAAQQADGSWRGANTAGATALLGSALQAAGQPQAHAVQFLVGQQLPDGSLPNLGKADLAATQRAALLLGDTSYLAASAPSLGRSATPATPTPTATASTTPSPEASATPTPTPSATASAPIGLPNPYDDGNNIGWILLPILLLALLAGGFYWAFVRPGKRAKKDAREAAVATEESGPTQPGRPEDSPGGPAAG